MRLSFRRSWTRITSAESGVEAALVAWSEGDDLGLTKLHVVRTALALRAERPAWFGPGEAGTWSPVRAEGAVVVGTRWPLTLERSGGWRDTELELPAGRWHDRLGGDTWEGWLRVGQLLAGLPVALLVLEA